MIKRFPVGIGPSVDVLLAHREHEIFQPVEGWLLREGRPLTSYPAMKGESMGEVVSIHIVRQRNGSGGSH